MINSVNQNTQPIPVEPQSKSTVGLLTKAKKYALSAADSYVSSNSQDKAKVNLGLNIASLAGLVGVFASGKHTVLKAMSAVVALASASLGIATNFINKGIDAKVQKDATPQEIPSELTVQPQEQVQAPQA